MSNKSNENNQNKQNNQENQQVEIETHEKPLDYALDLIEESGVSYIDLKKRNLGLQLSLLGLAGVQAKRVSTLLNHTQNLERRLFNPEHLNEMTPEETTKLYEVVSRSQRDSIDFVRLVISNTDWQKVEEELSVFQKKANEPDAIELPDNSEKVLHEIVKQLAMVKPIELEDKTNETSKKNKKRTK